MRYWDGGEEPAPTRLETMGKEGGEGDNEKKKEGATHSQSGSSLERVGCSD